MRQQGGSFRRTGSMSVRVRHRLSSGALCLRDVRWRLLRKAVAAPIAWSLAIAVLLLGGAGFRGTL